MPQNKFQALHIIPGGHLVPVEPANGKTFTLDEMYKYCGEPVEFVYPPGNTGGVMICNEEGKFSGLPFNEVATMLWQEGCDPGTARAMDDIMGSVLLCHESQLED